MKGSSPRKRKVPHARYACVHEGAWSHKDDNCIYRCILPLHLGSAASHETVLENQISVDSGQLVDGCLVLSQKHSILIV